MSSRPDLLNHTNGKPKVSVILIDWGVRESFHSVHYLNRQTVNRDDYELIWVNGLPVQVMHAVKIGRAHV